MLKVPSHQVAGHRAGEGRLGPLVDESGRFYKPLQGDERGVNEVAFYTSFCSNPRIPDHIRRYFPLFFGTQNIEASDGSGLLPHLVMNDVVSSHNNSSIMDIKIGSRTWAPRAREDYIEKCLKKDRKSSSVLLGFRLSGFQMYKNNDSGFWKPDKKYVQSLSAEEVKLALRKYVSSSPSPELDLHPDCSLASTVFGGPSGVLPQLLELKAWFENQTIFHFYSCSILMLYDKELALEGGNFRTEVKLIDFAHVVQGEGVIDHNFLGGLCSLIMFITEILASSNGFTANSSANGSENNNFGTGTAIDTMELS